MTGITDPAQEFFKDGLWAWVSTAWKKLVADASNFLQVNIAAQDIDVEVKQQTAADLTPGIKGWDGSAWRKLPLLWGYSDQYVEKEEKANASAGSNYLNFSTVPAGEVWTITNLALRDRNSDPTSAGFQLYDGSGTYMLAAQSSPGSDTWKSWAVNAILKAGDNLRAFFHGATLNDHLECTATGYKMKVAE